MSDLYYWKNLSPLTYAPTRQSILDHHEQILNKFFDDFFGNRKNFTPEKSYYPKMDIIETKDNLIINCAVPGMTENDIDIETVKETKTLKIIGQSISKDNCENDFAHLRELKHSAFTRSVQLPDYVDIETCHADLKDGILSLKFDLYKTVEEESKETIKKISIKKS